MKPGNAMQQEATTKLIDAGQGSIHAPYPMFLARPIQTIGNATKFNAFNKVA